MVADIAAGTAFLEVVGRNAGKAQGIIKLSEGQQSGVGGDVRTVEFQADFGVELESEGSLFAVTNDGPIYKFETLLLTQYYFLHQWAAGSFTAGAPEPRSDSAQLDEAGIGDCVGAPFSPGIETTWITRNAPIYAVPMQLRLAHFDADNAKTQSYYREEGLSTTADEAEGQGCEPGDLTKRMAIPWQPGFR